jgi:hypothetical protein
MTVARPVVSPIDVSRTANERVQHPQKLCDRISEIKMFPWYPVERGQDPVFDEIVRANDEVVPCLIEKVTDTTPMPDFTNDDVSKHHKILVGDIAVGLLQNITHVDLHPMIPDSFRHAEDSGDAAYYAYVKKLEYRKELQEKLWDWYRLYRIEGGRRAERTVKADELHQVAVSVNKPDIGRLEERDGKCLLVIKPWFGRPQGGNLALDLAPPCEFVRNETGGLETFAYLENNSLDWVSMVVGGPVDPNRSDQYMRTGCGTQIQIIRSGLPNALQKGTVGTGITVCPSEGVKEKVYALLAKSN